MAKKTRLAYDVVGSVWYEPTLKIFFTQLINQRIAEGWEPVGAAIRHPDPAQQFWWQTMVKRVPA
jgi:hypothetical protein